MKSEEPAGSTGTTPPSSGSTSTGSGTPSGSGASTGADGPTGAPGSTPSHPRSPAPPKTKAKVWNETPGGAHLNSAYESLRTTFAVHMSTQRDQIATLARRHIGG